MTRNRLILREKANIEKYQNRNSEASIDAIMQLYNRIPDIGSVYKSLFRYRSLNKYELEGLKRGTIFMRWPSSYDDDGDCTPVFNYEEITKYIIQKKYPGFDAEKLIDRFVDYQDLKNNPRVLKKIEDMRNMWMISCFTERYNNKRMWLEYADGNRGICLVYSFKDILEFIAKTDGMSIMPVRYVEDRNTNQEIMMNHRDLLEDSDEADAKYHLTCTTKDRLKYSFEEEWRLIFEKEIEDEKLIGDSIPFIDPLVIICGDMMDKSSEEYHELINIATRKGIKMIG